MSHPAALFALCIGHSRKISGRIEGGAVSHDGKENEHGYNLPLAIETKNLLWGEGFKCIIVSEYQGNGYGAAQRWLAQHLRDKGVTAALELHFNSAGPTATGHEWPHWHKSTQGERLASLLDQEFRTRFTSLKPRGLKPRVYGDKPNNRGWQFTCYPSCPSVICEPGFGSNPSDWSILQTNRSTIAQAYARALIAFASGNQK